MKRLTALLALALLAAVGCDRNEPELPTTVAYTLDGKEITCLAVGTELTPVSCDWNAWDD